MMNREQQAFPPDMLLWRRCPRHDDMSQSFSEETPRQAVNERNQYGEAEEIYQRPARPEGGFQLGEMADVVSLLTTTTTETYQDGRDELASITYQRCRSGSPCVCMNRPNAVC